jgi:acyl-CoA thioesterase I
MIRRPSIAVLLALATLAGGFYWLRSRGYDYANYPPSASGPWVAFGDSLTAGFGASAGQDYPAVLGRRLGRTIVNLGHSGDTTADGLRRLDDVLALRPSVVLVCLGGNDSLQKLPPAEMVANLRLICSRLREQAAFVVLIGVRSPTLRDRNEKLFRRLAAEQRALYVPDIFQGIFLKPIYMSDALHPNDSGYALIAERLERVLKPLFP